MEAVVTWFWQRPRKSGERTLALRARGDLGDTTRVDFEELAPEYPDITPEHLIIDNVAHQMAKNPAQFDVIVTTNLAGDIISDLASGLVGGLGFAASGNYGDGAAIFVARSTSRILNKRLS